MSDKATDEKNIDSKMVSEFEKEFRKTKTGKLFFTLAIIACVFTVIGLLLECFQAIVYLNNMEANVYEPIFDAADSLIECGGIIFLGYFLILWDYSTEKKRKGK